VRKVVAEMAKDVPPSWTEDFKAAARMFKEAGVDVRLVTLGGKLWLPER